MDFITKLLHTFFFVAVFIIFYTRYNKKYFIKYHYFIILIISLMVLFYLDIKHDIIPIKLFFILILFSISIPILNFIKDFINMDDHYLIRQHKNTKDKYINVKNLLFTKIIPIMILFYQILLIWLPVIYDRISKK